DPNFEGMVANVMRSMWPGYPGPFSSAAVEVQAQYVLCDMAGRVGSGGVSPEAALQEAHARGGEIAKIRRSSGIPRPPAPRLLCRRASRGSIHVTIAHTPPGLPGLDAIGIQRGT